jgi:hypothetical protein
MIQDTPKEKRCKKDIYIEERPLEYIEKLWIHGGLSKIP